VRVLALDTATEACSVALLDGEEIIGRYEELGKTHAQQILSMVDAVLAEAQCSLSMLDGLAASIGPGAFTGVRISVAVAQGLAFGADLRVVAVSTLEALALQALQSGAGHALSCLDARMGEVYWGCFAADPTRGLVERSVPRVGAPETVSLPDTARGADVQSLAVAAGLTDVPGAAVPGAVAPGAVAPGAVAPAAAALRLVDSTPLSVTNRYRGIGRGFAAYPVLATLPGVDLRPVDSRALPNAREIARLGALRLVAGKGIDPADLRPLYLRDKVALTEAERRLAKAP
jgi:tRNA threonylcarbamoyladenosine biosynthesis protein TsaB